MSIKNPVIRSRWQRFFVIPQDLQQALFGEPFAENVWGITKEKYDLPDASVSAVARIIGLIFLGELPIKNFIVALRDNLKIDAAKAAAIAQDINAAIFQPVRESLMAVHNIPQTNADYTQTNADNNQRNTNNINQVPSSKFQVPNNAPPPVSLDELDKHNPTNDPRSKIQDPRYKTQAPKPYQAKQTVYLVPKKNVVDLRNIKRKRYNKSRYEGFFSA